MQSLAAVNHIMGSTLAWVFLQQMQNVLYKPMFWHQEEELKTIVLCFLRKESSAKCCQTSVQAVAHKVCIHIHTRREGYLPARWPTNRDKGSEKWGRVFFLGDFKRQM